MRRRGGLAMAALLAALLTGLGVMAEAGAPQDQLRTSTEGVLKILEDPTLKGPDRAEERRKQLRTVVGESFDWQETARRALGRHWSPLNPQQRADFAALFADLVERSYLGKVEAYSGERIVYAGETVESDGATVRTKLVTRSQVEIPIDYRMIRAGERWRVYDVTIEGVSLVANYRAQFNRIIAQSGYEELVKRLKAKQDEVTFGDQATPKTSP